MAVVKERIIKQQGVTVHIVPTSKYKTNTLVWKMKAPLKEETVTLRALLPSVLQSNTEKYPTSTSFRNHLDGLYGASLFADVGKKGEYHIMSFQMDMVNEKYLSNREPLLEKAFELLSEVLTKPNSKEGQFDPSTVAKEKRALKQRLDSIYDDKMRYSSMRLTQEMCVEENYRLDASGIAGRVEEITPESLYAYYERAFMEDELDLYVIGDIAEEEVAEMANRYFQFSERKPERISYINHQVQEAKELQEIQDIKQGKLNIGYRTNITYRDSDYFALQMFNGIFGAFSHSKLFINVREKASLAYYAASRLESHKGLLMVMSGIDNKNYEQAVTIIKEQMEAMKRGDFSEQEIIQTKAIIKNQLLETIDTSRGLTEVLYHNVVAKMDISLDEWLARIDEVTREEIIACGEKIALDTIYFLHGTEVAE